MWHRRWLWLASAAVLACGSANATDPGISTPGFTFGYADSTGRHITFTADSGTWSITPGTFTVYTDMWASEPADLGTQALFQFATLDATPSPYRLPLGTYNLNDTLHLEMHLTAYGLDGISIGDSGSITIVRSDSVHLDGHLDAYMTAHTPDSLGPRFHLGGRFALLYHAVGP